MNKVYSFDEAYDIAEKLDNSDVQLENDENQLDAFEEHTLPLDEFGEELSISEIIKDFQNFMMEVLDELENIMETEKDKMDNVELDYEVLAQHNGVVQIYFSGMYMNFHYNHILVMPVYDWEGRREEVFKWVKAIVLREYKKFNGGF